MTSGRKYVGFLLLALAAGCGSAALAAPAQPVVAVLSSETGPYREAWVGFQDGRSFNVGLEYRFGRPYARP